MRNPSCQWLRAVALIAVATLCSVFCATDGAAPSGIPLALLKELNIAQLAGSPLAREGIVTVEDLRDRFGVPTMRSLGIKLGFRNRLLRWQREARASAVGVATAAAEVDAWGLPQVDYGSSGAGAAIERRASGEPMVIRNGLDPQMQKLVRQLNADAKSTQRLLPKLVGDERFARGAFLGVKWSNTPTFSEWAQDNAWMSNNSVGTAVPARKTTTGPGGLPGQHAWHGWALDMVGEADFFEVYNSPGPVYVYWDSPLRPEKLGIKHLRRTLCSRFASKALKADCAGETQEDGTVLWMNSGGQRAQAHFDAEQNIFVQLRGKKRVTLWAPQHIKDMCVYPYVHPSARQSQANFGDGVGIDCPAVATLRNHSVVLGPGDVLLLPPFWVHRVEALSPAISCSLNFNSHEAKAHVNMLEAIWQYVAFSDDFVSLRNQGPSKVSAGLRVLTRAVLTRALGAGDAREAFLKTDWAGHASLLDSAKFGGGAGVEQLCEEERGLSKPLRQRIVRHASVLDDSVANLPPDIRHMALRFVVGVVLRIAHGTYGEASPVFATKHLRVGATKAWHRALSVCDGGA